MLALEVIVAAVILIGVGWLLTARDREVFHDDPADRPDVGLPADRLLRSDDIARLRFRVVSGVWGARRGYRFSDVDETMAKLEETLRAHEHELEQRQVPDA